MSLHVSLNLAEHEMYLCLVPLGGPPPQVRGLIFFSKASDYLTNHSEPHHLKEKAKIGQFWFPVEQSLRDREVWKQPKWRLSRF